MPVVYREDDSAAWGTVAIVLVIALFALLIGYFAWWQPRVNAEPQRDVTIIQPESPPPPQQSPTVIPIPVPGPQGPAGPQGAPGPQGPSAPAVEMPDVNITTPEIPSTSSHGSETHAPGE